MSNYYSLKQARIYMYLLLWIYQIPLVLLARTHVAIDQEGYLPNVQKFVFVTQPLDSFYVIDTKTGEIQLKARLELWKSNDPSTGSTIYRGDFSALQKPGEYHIQTSNAITSYRFKIQDSVYNDIYVKALKAFYFQRCGKKLTSDYAGKYWHDQCHITDGFFHPSTGASSFIHATGGWHDAGDYGKYVVNAGVTVGTLLMAYELFPDIFEQDHISIPESGNGIPDILDEVRYELDWLLKMQAQNGGVYFKLTRQQFAPFIMPENDKVKRYVYEISTTATADFAAVMAKAARIYQPFDESYSQTCLEAAQKAWIYLETHSTIVPPTGFHNPEGTGTGEYGDSQDRDERLWAAAELFLTTGENTYHDYYINYYKQDGLIVAPMSWQNVRTLAHLAYLKGLRDGVLSKIHNELRSSLISYCKNLVKTRNESGFHVLLKPGEYNWGSNSQALNQAVLLIIGFDEAQDYEFFNVALDQLHYILGANVHNMSFVTGLGTSAPMYLHHRPSASDGIKQPIPGLLVGGPNQYLQDPILKSVFNAMTPPALCYIDHEGSYAANEIAINWNAPLVFVAGYFNGINKQMNINPFSQTMPATIRLSQNYPNPFNNRTMITFSLNVPQSVSLKIFNTLGKMIYEKKYDFFSVGEKQIEWSGVDQKGIALSSGVYFYYVEGYQKSKIKKLLFLK